MWSIFVRFAAGRCFGHAGPGEWLPAARTFAVGTPTPTLKMTRSIRAVEPAAARSMCFRVQADATQGPAPCAPRRGVLDLGEFTCKRLPAG